MPTENLYLFFTGNLALMFTISIWFPFTVLGADVLDGTGQMLDIMFWHDSLFCFCGVAGVEVTLR